MVYDILLPSLPFIIGYLGTYLLYRGGYIKKSMHINIWNLILGLIFLISGGGGFILLILLELGTLLPINIHLLYWHVELGLTLVLITIFHFHTYWKTSKKMFTINNGG
ncbi:MAG: hypothetical protein QME14_05355 [Methanobacteriaceae archaeon]|nr:hypothetical protein [Methanobacteriaceae archaeon]